MELLDGNLRGLARGSSSLTASRKKGTSEETRKPGKGRNKKRGPLRKPGNQEKEETKKGDL
jgi:hypothetical protein